MNTAQPRLDPQLCPLCGQRGQVLAAIYEGHSRRGAIDARVSGIGVGVSTNGVGGAMAGGRLSGTTDEKSLLAGKLAPPAKPAVVIYTWAVWIFAILGAVVLPTWILKLVEWGAFYELGAWLALALFSLVLCQVLGYSLFKKAPSAEAMGRYQHELEAWQRQRYCAADHLVYDPVTLETWRP